MHASLHERCHDTVCDSKQLVRGDWAQGCCCLSEDQIYRAIAIARTQAYAEGYADAERRLKEREG